MCLHLLEIIVCVAEAQFMDLFSENPKSIQDLLPKPHLPVLSS